MGSAIHVNASEDLRSLRRESSGKVTLNSSETTAAVLSPPKTPPSQHSAQGSEIPEIPEIQIRTSDIIGAIPIRGASIIAAVLSSLLYLPFSSSLTKSIAIYIAVLCGLSSYIGYRCWRLTLGQHDRRSHVLSVPKGTSPDLSSLPGIYWMYILGSGGHTSEMIQTVKASLQMGPQTHRRYVATRGDKHSLHAAHKLEQQIHRKLASQSGTSDILKIQRARAVHQSLLSAIVPAIGTLLETIGLLTRTPDARSTQKDGDTFRYPSVIVTNGPGTCFIVAIVAFILRVLRVVPENMCRVIYIETWAHVSSLSLTGKLFHLFGIADLFCVQHPDLAKKLGKCYLPVVSMPQPAALVS